MFDISQILKDSMSLIMISSLLISLRKGKTDKHWQVFIVIAILLIYAI